MTTSQRLDILLKYLAPGIDNPDSGLPMPESEREKFQLFRSLVNRRPPLPVTKTFLTQQDRYLKEISRRRGVVDAMRLPPSRKDNRVVLWKGDITTLKADAIVNPANSSLLGCFTPGHNCADNAIHTYAGVQLRLLCNEIIEAQHFPEPPGGAKITPGFNLPCRYILHTVGPNVEFQLTSAECGMLESCYNACLALAEQNTLESIAFCCIATAEYGFPNKPAAKIATDTVRRYLDNNPNSSIKRVVFSIYRDVDFEFYSQILE